MYAHIHPSSGDLSDKQRRFKVDVNVQQWNLKGTALLHPEFHVVVVEGGMAMMDGLYGCIDAWMHVCMLQVMFACNVCNV